MTIKRNKPNRFNKSKFIGQLVCIEPKSNGAIETVDFQIKVKRNLKQEIYDYIDCSIYHEEANRLLRLVKVGDMIEIEGEFRSSKQEIEKEIVTKKFAHFLVKKISRI